MSAGIVTIGRLIMCRARAAGSRLVCTTFFISVFFALFFPYVNISSFPLHIAIPILFFAFLVLASTEGLGKVFILLLVLVITAPFFGGFFSALKGYDIQLSKVMYSSLPVAVLLVSFYIAFKLNVRVRVIQVYLIFIVIVFLLVLVSQNFPYFRAFYSLVGLIPDHRIGFFESYYIVTAPMANPNNSGLIAALLIMALVYFNFNAYKVPVCTRALIAAMCVMLLFGLVFSYARTVLAGFLISFAMLVCAGSSLRVKFYALSLVVLLITGLAFYLGGEREFIYYMTILSFQDDHSFTSRYYYWLNILRAFQDNPYSIFVGFGRYQDVIVSYQESAIIDSSYLYFIAQYGLLIVIVFLALILRAAVNVPYLISFIPIFALSSVTLAYFSDVRMNVVIGFVLGLICNGSGLVKSLPNRNPYLRPPP